MREAKLSIQEIDQLEWIAERMNLPYSKTAEKATEYSLERLDELKEWIPHHIMDFTVPAGEFSITYEVPRGYVKATDEINYGLSKNAIHRAFIYYAIFENEDNFQLNLPKRDTGPNTDASVLIDEEEGRQIIKDDIMGLGSEEKGDCSICGDNEVYLRGMCKQCLQERGGAPI